MGLRFRSAEGIFTGLLVVAGLLYAAVLPPCQAPDENKHFLRAYHVSEGHLRAELTDAEWARPAFGASTVGLLGSPHGPGPLLAASALFPGRTAGWAGGNLPESVGRCADAFKYLHNDRELKDKVNGDTLRSLAADRLDPERRLPTSFEGAESNANVFVIYLPQAAGIALGRFAGLNPLGLHYAGRLANLAFAVLLVALAIRITPVGKLVFGLVALLPLGVQQFASLSPDASIIAVSFLLTAVLLRAALVGVPAGWGLVARVGGLAAWVTACKVTLAPLVLLCLAVPRKVLGSWLRYLAGIAVISVAVLLPVYAVLAPPELPGGPKPKEDVPPFALSPAEQKQLVRANPLRFLGVVATTCAHRGGVPLYFDHLFTLGWVNTPIPRPLAHPYALVLLFVALASPSPPIPLRVRAALLCAVVACALALFLALYLYYTAPGADFIYGVQGRYFIPFLPPALLLLSNQLRLTRIAPQRLLALAVAAGVAELIVSLGTMVGRDHCPEPWPLWTVGGSVILAAVAVVVVWRQPSVGATV